MYTYNKRKDSAYAEYKQAGREKMNSLYISTHTRQQIWPDFIAHFQSETTMASYQTDLDEFMNYIEKDFTKATESDVRTYYEYLAEKV